MSFRGRWVLGAVVLFGATALVVAIVALVPGLMPKPDFVLSTDPDGSSVAGARVTAPTITAPDAFVGMYASDVWVAPNQNADIHIVARYASQTVQGVRFGLAFEPSRLDVIGVTPADSSPSPSVDPGVSPVQSQPWNVDHARGIVSVGELDFTGLDQPTAGEHFIATVHVRTHAEGDATLHVTSPELVVPRGFSDQLRAAANAGSATVHVDRRGMCGADITSPEQFSLLTDRHAGWNGDTASVGQGSGRLSAQSLWLKPGEEGRVPILLESSGMRDLTFGLNAEVPEGSPSGAVSIERVDVDPCVGYSAAGARLGLTPWLVLSNNAGVSMGAVHIAGGDATSRLCCATEIAAVVVRAQHPGRLDLHFSPALDRYDSPIVVQSGDGPPSPDFTRQRPGTAEAVAAVPTPAPPTPTLAPFTPNPLTPGPYVVRPNETVAVPRVINPSTALTAPPAAAARMQFEPGQMQLRVGQSAILDLVIDLDPGVPTRGAQAGLRYDPRLLSVEGMEPGSFYTDWADQHDADWITLPAWKADQTRGEVSVGAIALLGTNNANRALTDGPTGHGTFARLHLRALAPGTTRLQLLDPAVSVPGPSTSVAIRSRVGNYTPEPSPRDARLESHDAQVVISP
jgi:hypothetical protein